MTSPRARIVLYVPKPDPASVLPPWTKTISSWTRLSGAASSLRSNCVTLPALKGHEVLINTETRQHAHTHTHTRTHLVTCPTSGGTISQRSQNMQPGAAEHANTHFLSLLFMDIIQCIFKDFKCTLFVYCFYKYCGEWFGHSCSKHLHMHIYNQVWVAKLKIHAASCADNTLWSKCVQY